MAKQQAGIDQSAAERNTLANRPNQTNPWGSSTWTMTPGAFDQKGYDAAMADYNSGLEKYQTWKPDYTGGDGTAPSGMTTNPFAKPQAVDRSQFEGNPSWSQTSSLNPQNQANFDKLGAGVSGAIGRMGTPASAGMANANRKLTNLPELYDPSFAPVKEVQEAMMSRLAPDMLRARQQQEAQLIAQGVGGNTGGEAWDRSQQLIGRNENDMMMQALLAGAAENQNIFNRTLANRGQVADEQMGMANINSGADIANAGNQTQVSLGNQDARLKELLGMLAGQRSIANNGFDSFALQQNPGGADILGAAQQQYGAAMDAANAKNQAKSNLWGTVGGLAGSIFGGPVGGAIGKSIFG